MDCFSLFSDHAIDKQLVLKGAKLSAAHAFNLNNRFVIFSNISSLFTCFMDCFSLFSNNVIDKQFVLKGANLSAAHAFN